ncbi:MAG: BtpA family membrane complex biogenesis protein [Ruminococcaceae bacterium]|nr:BtpA family membrane complex biogenesis protein [Oscillospiraceae bacterium]
MFKDKKEKIIIGLVHLRPMPGTPYYKEGDYDESIEKALKDVAALVEGGANGCLLQTSDRIYPATDDTDYVRATCLASIGTEVRKAVSKDFIVGVQIMWNCITPSLAVAKACKADFTRCTALVGKTESPYGTIIADPLKVLTYKNSICMSEDFDMLAEIAGYHFKGEYSKENLQTLAGRAIRAGATAIEILDKDEAMNERKVLDVKEAFPDIPIILGGGTNAENVQRRLKYCEGALVGTYFEDGNWGGPINPETVKKYMDIVRSM